MSLTRHRTRTRTRIWASLHTSNQTWHRFLVCLDRDLGSYKNPLKTYLSLRISLSKYQCDRYINFMTTLLKMNKEP